MRSATTPPASRSERVAYLISGCTSPYMVAAVTAAVAVLLLRPTLSQLLLWGGICVLTGAIIPFLIVLILWRKHRISDIHVAVRAQREIPFVAALLSASVGVAALWAIQAPAPLIGLGAIYLINGLMLALISLRWKISVHASVFTAGIISVALISSPNVLWGLFILPLVMWARVKRQRHTWAQGIVPVILSGILTPFAYRFVISHLGG
ncbi:MAG: hypothetical protein ACYC63_05770 [Armatimonadota bacterium]